jgi:flagellar biogenesis protein FliO
MLRTLRLALLVLLAHALASPLSAEPVAGPPAWADSSASVYLGMKPQPTAEADPAVRLAGTATEDTTALASPAATTPTVDVAVGPALREAAEPLTQEADARRLAPPKSDSHLRSTGKGDGRVEKRPTVARPAHDFGIPFGSLYSIASSLGIVIGAFLLFAWLLRRGGGKTTSALPAEVVGVLGRVPLAARHFAELLRVGNKLVLISLTPTGAETLTEITDPAEVDRLVGLCQQYGPNSTTKAFEQVFRHLSSEPAPRGFLGGESLPSALPAAGAAFRSRPGETARA